MMARLTASLAIMAMLATAGAAAQPAAPALTADSQGRIEFEAPTYENFGTFRNRTSKPGKAALTIWLPPGNGPFPAVIVGHSIGGWNEPSEGYYVKFLREAGYVVAGLDHFGPRNIARAADVPGAFTPITSVSDALLALKLLATHPKVKADRIGVMGLSMGGITSELSAYEYVRRGVLGDSPLKFAAHLPIYGPCGYVYSNGGGRMTTGSPMLKLYAGKDETTPRQKCDRIDAVIRAADPQARIETVWYPDAYHAWENPARQPRFFPNHVNAAKCPIMDWGSQVRFIDTNGAARPFSGPELQSCIRASTGYSMGYSEGAAKDAPVQMLAFFKRHLKDN